MAQSVGSSSFSLFSETNNDGSYLSKKTTVGEESDCDSVTLLFNLEIHHLSIIAIESFECVHEANIGHHDLVSITMVASGNVFLHQAISCSCRPSPMRIAN